MQLKPITAIAVLLLVVASLLVSGCTVNPTPTPTPVPTVVTPTPTVKATSTPKPTPTPTPDYSSKLNNNPNWIGEDYIVSSSFHKTTVNGKVCYVGSLSKMGYTFQMQVFPMNSYTDALSYRETLINAFKAQGYVTSSVSGDQWYGTSGNMGAWVHAYDETSASGPAIGVPVTMAWSGVITG
jgi:hypothetical protein